MDTLKKGSKGDSVKTLQKALGITPADGIFGTATEKVVKEFQEKHNLTPVDGIVGTKTWNAINSSKTVTGSIDSDVIYLPLSQHITKLSNRDIKYLVIHFSGSSNSKSGRAKNMKNTFESRAASADFGVDDTDMVQFNPNPKNYYCWSVGDKPYSNNGGSFHGKVLNKNSISIEICSTCTPSTSQAVSTSNHSGWSFTDAALQNATKLAKVIMKKYNIPIDRVVRHYDVSGKLCPGIIGWNDEPIKDINGKKTGENSTSEKWKKFKEGLEK